MTRIKPSFYLYNTESFKVLPGLHRPWDTFDLLFCPTAGYKAELLVDKLNFKGEVIFYDYTQENIDAKKSIVDMNMSLDEIYNYGGLVHSNIVFSLIQVIYLVITCHMRTILWVNWLTPIINYIRPYLRPQIIVGFKGLGQLNNGIEDGYHSNSNW